MTEIVGRLALEQTKRMKIIPSGAIFIITSGEYSEYSVHGIFVALMNIDADDVMAQWLIDNPEQRGHFRFLNKTAFLAHCVKLGLFKLVDDTWEWHFSGYGQSEMTIEKTDPA